MRARMALASSVADPEIREVRLRDKPATMLALSSKGTVPVLQLETGEVLDESLDIMRWGLALSDPQGWLRNIKCPTRNALVITNDSAFKTALDHYKYPSRYPGADAQSARLEGLNLLEALDPLLQEAPFLDGPEPGFFDAAIFPFVRQFAAVDDAWFCHAASRGLKDWRKRLLEHPVFTSIMRKLPPWQVGDEPLSFRSSLLG